MTSSSGKYRARFTLEHIRSRPRNSNAEFLDGSSPTLNPPPPKGNYLGSVFGAMGRFRCGENHAGARKALPCALNQRMFARKIRVEYDENNHLLPCPLKWLDSFSMRNFTNASAFDDTLPISDGQMGDRFERSPEPTPGRDGGLVSVGKATFPKARICCFRRNESKLCHYFEEP